MEENPMFEKVISCLKAIEYMNQLTLTESDLEKANRYTVVGIPFKIKHHYYKAHLYLSINKNALEKLPRLPCLPMSIKTNRAVKENPLLIGYKNLSGILEALCLFTDGLEYKEDEACLAKLKETLGYIDTYITQGDVMSRIYEEVDRDLLSVEVNIPNTLIFSIHVY